MDNPKKINGLRQLIIHGMTREQQINFIIRRDSSFRADSSARLTDKEVRNIALTLDKNFQADRQKKTNNKNHGWQLRIGSTTASASTATNENTKTI